MRVLSYLGASVILDLLCKQSGTLFSLLAILLIALLVYGLWAAKPRTRVVQENAARRQHMAEEKQARLLASTRRCRRGGWKSGKICTAGSLNGFRRSPRQACRSNRRSRAADSDDAEIVADSGNKAIPEAFRNDAGTIADRLGRLGVSRKEARRPKGRPPGLPDEML